MTILVTAITQTQCVQVSDRRRTGSGASIDTDHKAVDVCSHLMFATGGDVSIGGRESMDWFTSVIPPGIPPADIPETLATAAKNQVDGSLIETGGISFLGAGWVPDENGTLRPMWCSVSNIEEDFAEFRDDPADRFWKLVRFVEDDLLLHVWRPPKIPGCVTVLEDLERGKAALRTDADLDDPNSIAEHLIHYAQSIATREGRNVIGSSLLVRSLPLAGAGKPSPISVGPFAPLTLSRDVRSRYTVRREDDAPTGQISAWSVCPDMGGVVMGPTLGVTGNAADFLDMVERDPFFSQALVPDELRKQAEEERARRSARRG